MNGVGGSDDCSTSSETNDGTRAPYAASISVNDSDTALCSESWLNIESVGDVGDSGTAGERGVVGVDAIARSPSVDARITSAGNACDVGEDGNPCAEGDVGQGNAGTGGIESVTETGPLKGRRAKRS